MKTAKVVSCLWCGVVNVPMVPRTIVANGAPCALCRVCAGEVERPKLPSLLAPKSAEQIEREETLASLVAIRAKHAASPVEPWTRAGIGFGWTHFGQSCDGAIADVVNDIARLERRRKP